jgi:hypothetical protein
MGIPVVIVVSGGLPVTVSTSGYGVPMTEALFGIPVTQATNGLPVTGITFGPDVTAPIITSASAVSWPENSILNHVLAANEAVTWAKVGGADTAKFTLVGNTLTLPAKDFENPDDAGLNNTYIVQVQATDLASNVSLVQTITVTITDVFEVGPTAPVLAMDAAWVTTDATPDFTIDVDDTIGAGDSVQLQIAVALTSFAAPVDDVTHVITAPEDAANEINVASGSVSNGDYEARARVSDGTPSAWSNTVPFTVAAVASGHGLLWGTDAIVWGADYMTWEAIPKVLTYRDQQTSAVAGLVATFSVDIGTAAVDRCVIVGLGAQVATNPTSVTVNGVALVLQEGNSASGSARIYSGLVTTGSGVQSVVVTHPSGAGFTNRNVTVWTVTGLSSTTKKQSVNGVTTALSVNADAGDFILAVRYYTSGTPVWTASTEAPAATHNLIVSATADWTVAATNASFSVSCSGVSLNSFAAATFA